MKSLSLFASAIALAAAGAANASEAARDVLPATAAPVSYDIVLTPDMAAKTFAGEARLTFNVKKKTDRIVVNGADLTIASATLETGEAATVEVDKEGEKIAFVFAKPLKKGEHRIDVVYAGKIYDQAAGLFISTYPTASGQKSMLATQFEPGDARKLAPMWDEPAHKAVFNVSAIAPEGMDVVSNMPVEKQTPQEDGAVRYDFAASPKMSSYLLYFGMGDLDRIAADHDGIELGIVTQAGDGEKGRYALEETGDILDYYHDYFGVKYPLPKLDQIAVPGAGGFGAMENWGAILYFEPVLLLDPKLSTAADKQRIFSVVAHEVAHQWFGDLVTMQWWDDLWLNEGYASWMETKVADVLHPEWNPWLQSLGGKEYAFSLDSVASTHPVVQTVRNIGEATLAFDAITYQKGEAVIRMIEAYVGEEAFRNGVRSYMAKHAYGNTVSGDLWREVQAASDAPVTDIARDFTTQPGVPMIYVDSVACDEAKNVSTVTLRQGRYGTDAASKEKTLAWRTPVTAAAIGGEAVARATISGGAPQTMTVEGCGGVNINVDETGYFRTLYADEPFEAMKNGFASLSGNDQLGLIYDSYALGASNDAPFARFLALVDETPADGDAYIVGAVASSLARLNETFKGEPGADLYAAFARDWLKPAFARVGWDAKPGESENEAVTRTKLIGALASMDDKAVVAEARKRFASYVKNQNSVSPALARTVLSIAGAKADRKTFDQLLTLAKNAKTPREQRTYLSALADVEDEALAQRAIDVFFDKEITPVQLAPRLFGQLAGEHPRMVWDYYRANREKIDALLDPLENLRFGPGIASASSDPAVADELEAFAAEYLPESAKPTVATAATRIRFAAAVKEKQLPQLVEWLEARN
ncbi:MAG: M1 family metallopeptidase [Pseudomonadota bacterium]|nr:M1 family metallopeptidase [Pseudomonadota bacterium]